MARFLAAVCPSALERRFGGAVPEDLVLVTPASLAEDRRFRRIYEGR